MKNEKKFFIDYGPANATSGEYSVRIIKDFPIKVRFRSHMEGPFESYKEARELAFSLIENDIESLKEMKKEFKKDKKYHEDETFYNPDTFADD